MTFAAEGLALRLGTALGVAAVLSLSACAAHSMAGGGAAAPPERVDAAAVLVRVAPARVGMDPKLNSVLDSIMRHGLAEGAAPGAALAVGRHGRLVHLRSYGRIDTAGAAPLVTDSTLFDMASLTKVVATTTAAMILEEEGRLDIDRPVRDFLPALDAPDKAAIT
ncbi:MAG: serine hydrolase domain-containing protein, partial [Longimicrobiales bacterium]